MTMANEIKFTQEEIKYVKLTDIFADTNWNSRSLANTIHDKQQEGETETNGIKSLCDSLEMQGQDTPCIVRVSSDVGYAKVKEPYALVAGFRRYKAFEMINTPDKAKIADESKRTIVPGLANGTIKVIVRKLDDKEARLLNTRENTGREQLETPDQMLAVLRLVKEHKMDKEDIAKSLGISVPWVYQLLDVGGKLDKNVFDHWRNGGLLKSKEHPQGEEVASPKGGKKRLPWEAIKAVSQVDRERQVEEYKNQIAGIKDKEGKKDWWNSSEEKAEKQGKYIAGLCKAGLFSLETQDKIDWFALVDSGKLFKLNKNVSTKELRKKLAKKAEKAFITEYNRDETDVDDDDEENEEGEE